MYLKRDKRFKEDKDFSRFNLNIFKSEYAFIQDEENFNKNKKIKEGKAYGGGQGQ